VLTPEEERRAEELFASALDLPEADRDGFISRACLGQPLLEKEVRLLMAHYAAAPAGFLQSPTGDAVTQENQETIGPYELQEVLGEGGMGVVYRARQTSPVVRTVALKILKLGMDSKEVLARFEAERQALAQLEHPNIARVYDAGTTPDGRPYFVMEYVQGQAITTYCDEKRLTPRQRIALFVELCRGVQHAHQQGIIHRDLKPTNLLVAEQDGLAIPKVIDFGVAKAVQSGLPDATLFTQLGQLVGTPEYMSPEQAEAAPVDTRTDVYSLGAVLYELLVGVLPIDAATLREAGVQAMMRLIREQDPPRPSARASTLAASATTVADRRSVAPRALVRSLRGELDWIALKALEKNRDRRYATVAELATDLKRHLADEPVEARPPSTWYTLGKFARRHRMGVGIALTLGLAMGVIAVGSTIQAGRLARERDRANHQAAVSRQVKDFLVDIFYLADPEEAQGRDITAREILDLGAAKVTELTDPSVRAELTGTLGAVYQNLGLYSRSDSLYIAAKDLWIASEGLNHPESLQAVGAVAGIYTSLGRNAEAESLFTVEIAGWDRLGLAEDRRSFDAMSRLATALRNQRRYAEAESLLMHSLAGWRRLDGEDNVDVLRIRKNLAYCYYRQNKLSEAEPIYEDVLQRLRRVEGGDSPRTLKAMMELANLYVAQDRFAPADTLLQQVHAASQRIFGTAHPQYVSTLESLASLYYQQEKHSRAVPLFEEILTARGRIYGDSHPSTIVARHNLAAVNYGLERYADAEPLARKTLAQRLDSVGDEHPFTQQTRQMLAMILVSLGQYDEAMEHLQIAVDHGFAESVMVSEETLDLLAPMRGRSDLEALLDVVRQRLAEKEQNKTD
jgi:non-specific serine/threonine protein kinase/serine/threonine-protein kinase